MPRYVLPLRKADDPASVGVKSYILGILFREGFPVPDGFLINNKAYRKFLVANNLESRILDLYNSTDLSNYENIENLSQEIKRLILASSVPDDVKDEVLQAYKFMNIGEVAPIETTDILRAGKDPFKVIVRASVDSKFNFPGLFHHNETFGPKGVLDSIKDVWASLHNADAILYRNKLHINHDMDMCVMIQKEIESEKSGIAITSKKTIVESTWGMSKAILKSQVSPDRFIIDDNKIESKSIGRKKIIVMKDESGNIKTIHSGAYSERLSLQDSEVIKINSLLKKIETFFKNKIIIEWSIDGNKLYVLQCRSHNFNLETPPETHSDSLVKGLPVSHGYTSGKVRFQYTDNKDIIVAENPTSLMCIVSSAVITEHGSYGSSNALLSREMGIPALFGAEHVTRLVKEGQKVTLDCYEGCLHVFENDEEIKAIVTSQQTLKGFWIDTPGAALTMKGINKEDTIFFDIEKISKLMFGSDYSMELTAHESVVNLLKSIHEKCDNVFIFWRREPEDYILAKLAETNVKSIVQVMSKDIL